MSPHRRKLDRRSLAFRIRCPFKGGEAFLDITATATAWYPPLISYINFTSSHLKQRHLFRNINCDSYVASSHSLTPIYQCRSKGDISGGGTRAPEARDARGSGGTLPQKILKSRSLEILFPAISKSYLWFTHTANYLLLTLSRQTNSHWEYNTCNVNYKIENRLSLYLETSKCFTFQSHHSKFVVIKLSELP